MRDQVRSRLAPVFTARFAKFCAVGASGVVVNFSCLGLLTTLGVHNNVASALAIELSLLSNFVVNVLWTFSDRRGAGGSLLQQCGRFHLVSFGGALIQFSVFVAMNMLWFTLLADLEGGVGFFDDAGRADPWLVRAFLRPPDVGPLMYLSQGLGIGVATLWNYLVNFHWTWGARPSDEAEA